MMTYTHVSQDRIADYGSTRMRKTIAALCVASVGLMAGCSQSKTQATREAFRVIQPAVVTARLERTGEFVTLTLQPGTVVYVTAERERESEEKIKEERKWFAINR